MTSDAPIWSSVARHFHTISLCRLACWGLALCAMSSGSMPGDELTRYQKWHQHHPFTQSAWYSEALPVGQSRDAESLAITATALTVK